MNHETDVVKPLEQQVQLVLPQDISLCFLTGSRGSCSPQVTMEMPGKDVGEVSKRSKKVWKALVLLRNTGLHVVICKQYEVKNLELCCQRIFSLHLIFEGHH